MGDTTSCTLHFEGRSERGTALLEQHDLTFRGPLRLSIPLRDIRSASADGGKLTVTFAERRAVFEIGASAARWAQRIANPRSRLDKLGVKADMLVVMAGVVHADLAVEVKERGVRLLDAPRRGGADLVFYGADKRSALARVRALRRALKPAGALWIIRPKGSPAITEAEVMAAGKEAGLVDVKVVSFSPTHTAEKFVMPVSAR
jgi:hypothetical protein